VATTTARAFDEFYDAIKEDDTIRQKVSDRRTNVVNVLKAAFPSSATMQYQSATLIGSLGRHTASRPFDDMDLLVHLYVDEDL